jgi:hypothetical protein
MRGDLMTPEQLKALTDEMDADDELDAAEAELAALEAEDGGASAKTATPAPTKAAAPTPAPKPEPAAPIKPRLGLQKNGTFYHTASQLRDSAWCFANQSDMTRALKLELVPE